MFRHVVFLEHIPFFSISSITHNLTRPDLIRIDPFFKDSDILSSQVPSTSNTSLHGQPIYTHNFASIDTLLSSTLEASFLSISPQTLSEIVDPPLRQSIRIRKSTKPLDFVYSCYYSSFTSFLASIHCLCDLPSYKEAILDLFCSRLWIRNVLLCIRHIIGIWFLYLLVRVLLVIIVCIRSRLILIGLLSDTKLGLL